MQRNADKYPGKTVAEESMLTLDMLTWTLGATIGIKYSQEFALHKQAQKVKTITADAEPEPEPTPDPDPSGDDTDDN